MADRTRNEDENRYDHSDHPVNQPKPDDLKSPGASGRDAAHSRHPGANPAAIDERQSPNSGD
jgi:hypothetical protein